MKASETQIAGQHYKDFPIQPAEFCQRNRLNWCEANVVKYVCRHAEKKGAEDIRKAIHYLELLLEWEYPQLDELYLHGTHCDTCARPDCAKGEYPATKDGGCEGYIMVDHLDPYHANMEATKRDFCPNCRDYKQCAGTMINPDGKCTQFRDKRNPSLCHSDLPCGDFSAKDAPTAAERPAPHTGGLVARPPVPKTGIPVNCSECCTPSACVGKGVNLTLDQGCGHYVPKEAAK